MQRFKKIISWALVIVAAIYTGIVGMKIYQFYFPEGGFRAACVQETKTCEDGTVVGRINHTCDLAPCPEPEKMTEDAAREVAVKECVKDGESVGEGEYDEDSRRWQFDIELKEKRKGCEPVCLVSEKNKDAKINWNCEEAKK